MSAGRKSAVSHTRPAPSDVMEMRKVHCSDCIRSFHPTLAQYHNVLGATDAE